MLVNNYTRYQQGFTLVEMMITVVILGVLASIAVPAMSSYVNDMRVKTAANDLAHDVIFARTEALKRNQSITVEPVNGDWTLGWEVVTPDGVSQRRPGLLTTTVVTSHTVIEINGQGRPSQTNLFFSFVSTVDSALARCLRVSLTGIPNVYKGSCT